MPYSSETASEVHYYDSSSSLIETRPTLYDSVIPTEQDNNITCTTQELHVSDVDSDSSSSSSSSSTSLHTSQPKHSKKKHRRPGSTCMDSRTPSFEVSEAVKKQGDIAIHDLLERLQRRQDSFEMMSTIYYDRTEVVHGYIHGDQENDDDDGGVDDNNNGGEINDCEEVLRVAVHHQGLAPELLESLGLQNPHALRQHHGNANLRHV